LKFKSSKFTEEIQRVTFTGNFEGSLNGNSSGEVYRRTFAWALSDKKEYEVHYTFYSNTFALQFSLPCSTSVMKNSRKEPLKSWNPSPDLAEGS
jgi:hypothetical protein